MQYKRKVWQVGGVSCFTYRKDRQAGGKVYKDDRDHQTGGKAHQDDNREDMRVGGSSVTAADGFDADGSVPVALLLQPVDEHDLEVLDAEVEEIAVGCGKTADFILTAFQITDWNNQLSPWPAPAVFGREDFGDGAGKTLDFVLETLLPSLIARGVIREDTPVILGGYSLAGFFALWSAYQTDRFAAIAAASPSVWFPGWMEYVGGRASRTPQREIGHPQSGDVIKQDTEGRVPRAGAGYFQNGDDIAEDAVGRVPRAGAGYFQNGHDIAEDAVGRVPRTQAVYLSLGDREERTRSQVMAAVGVNIRRYSEILRQQGVASTLEWNPGNHFRDSDKRCAAAFSWCLGRLAVTTHR